MTSVQGRLAASAQIFVATMLLVTTLAVASSVFAPLAFAVVVLALVWPLQSLLQRWMPAALALLICFATIALAFVAFGYLIGWAFSQVGRWVIADASRYQALYDEWRLWLEEHGIVVGLLSAEGFNANSLIGVMRMIGGRLNSAFSFWLIALIYVLLGLLEVKPFQRRIAALRNREASQVMLVGAAQTASKLRRYLVIRSIMSGVTGTLVWALAYGTGLPLAEEWGFIAFALNYIPVIGPLIATCLPTLFSMTHFETWQGVLLLLVALNLIQFVVGSYIEPRVSGSALSVSPVLVLFSVFLWGALWGIVGAFMGVPITIAVLTFCAQHPSTRWLSELFGAAEAQATALSAGGSES